MPVDLWGEDVEPRKWQAEALPLVQAELRRGGGPIVWACTGAGKSILQRALIAWVMQSDKPGVIVVDVPTRSLVRQLAATLEQHPWLKGKVGTYYGDRKKLVEKGVIVCCRPSLARLAIEVVTRGWKVRLYMVDEAHLSPDEQAGFIARLVDAELGPARRIGVTATPYRSDIKDSLELWDRVVVEYGLNDAIRDGVLVNLAPRTWQGPALEIDEVCTQMLAEHAHHGPMLVNALDIPDAEAFAARLRAAGLPAQSIHSGHSMERRKELEDALRSGDLACLVHVATLVEGVDWPWLRVLCLRRQAILRARSLADMEDGKPASKGGSRVRLVQEIGRALRTYPGKTEAYILDPVGVCDLVGLVHGENIGGEAKRPGEGEGEPTGPREVKPRDLVYVYSTNQILAWLSQAHQFGELAGHIERTRGRGWRSRAPSDRQMEALQKEAERPRIYLPRAIAHMARAGAEALLANPDAATKGAVSDVLGLIYAGQRAYFDEKDRLGRWPSGEDWWRGAIPPLPDGITIKD